jgi:hypothetical protein
MERAHQLNSGALGIHLDCLKLPSAAAFVPPMFAAEESPQVRECLDRFIDCRKAYPIELYRIFEKLIQFWCKATRAQEFLRFIFA